MTINHLFSQGETLESTPPPGRLQKWRGRLQRLRIRAMSAAPFALGAAGALVVLLLYRALTPTPHQVTTSDVNASVAHALAAATPLPALSEQVYQVIQPSLILVQAQMPGAHGLVQEDVGSGVIVDTQGDILTSLHVVTQATTIQVTFADGTQSAAQVTTAQPENDIAVLRASKPPAHIVAATLGNPSAMHVGDEAFVVGNPFGLYGSMSAGVISGFNRSLRPAGHATTLHNLIQIDAAVNPGNSGGPLLNRSGEVIGIVTGLVNPTAQNFFVGIGLAVSITAAGGAAGAPPY